MILDNKQKNFQGCSARPVLLLISKRSEMPWSHLKIPFNILGFDIQLERGTESQSEALLLKTEPKNNSGVHVF